MLAVFVFRANGFDEIIRPRSLRIIDKRGSFHIPEPHSLPLEMEVRDKGEGRETVQRTMTHFTQEKNALKGLMSKCH